MSVDSMVGDALREIGNIGCGNALTALSMFTSADFKMSVTDIEVIHYSMLTQKIGNPEDLSVSIALDITGDIDGMFMFISDEPLIHSMLSKLGLDNAKGVLALDEMQSSALLEIGNIVASSYIRALSDISGLKIRISVPSLAVDMLGATLTLPVLRFAVTESKIIYVKNNFMIDGHGYSGNMLLMPESSSVDILMKKLGVR